MPVLLMAGMRDASMFKCPGRAGRFHIINHVTNVPACGVLSPPGLVDIQSPDDIPAVLRCRRRGCAENWPTKEPG